MLGVGHALLLDGVLVRVMGTVRGHLMSYTLKHACTFPHAPGFTEKLKAHTQRNRVGGVQFCLEKPRQRLNQSSIHRGRNETRDWAACSTALQVEYSRGQFPTLIIHTFFKSLEGNFCFHLLLP